MARTVKHLGDRLVEDFFNAGQSWKTGITAEDVDAAELAEGANVELEHSRDPVVVVKIGVDHLAEHKSSSDDFDRYYTGLSILEQVLRAGRLDLLIAWAEEFGMEPKLRKLSPAMRGRLGIVR